MPKVLSSPKIPGVPSPLRPTFVRRNRIIAGLAALVLIVEAGLPSGTFSTADAALRANRDVAAVPGSITSPNSRGTNHLIAQGAYCVVDTEALDSAIELAWAHSMYELLSDRVTKGEGDACDDLIGDDPVLRALAAEALSASSSRPTSTSLPASFRDALPPTSSTTSSNVAWTVATSLCHGAKGGGIAICNFLHHETRRCGNGKVNR